MRRAEVRRHGQLAGHLTQDEQGYTFAYVPAYLAAAVEPVSLTLPLRLTPYVERVLFPFFDGLIPEGWLLEVAEKNWKLSARDQMSLLPGLHRRREHSPAGNRKRMMSRCLFCYQRLPEGAGPDYHPACSRRLFGKSVPPAFPYTEAEMLALAEAVVRQHITVTGVQPKLSLTIAPAGPAGQPARFTIVGALGGEYILKPPTARYPYLPEVEDVTMHLAALYTGRSTLTPVSETSSRSRSRVSGKGNGVGSMEPGAMQRRGKAKKGQPGARETGGRL